MKRIAVFFLLLTVLASLGCAHRDMLVTPGRVNAPAAQGQPTEKWSFWVRTVVDQRPADFVGTPRIGKLGQRFDEQQTMVYLDAVPDQYLRDQLKLFLLSTGMEAASADKAKIFLDVTLTSFAVEVDNTSVLDKLDFSLDFDIKFYAADGQYLGSVRLPEKRWIKLFSPFGSNQESLELLIRDTLSSTFGLLAQSDVFKSSAEK